MKYLENFNSYDDPKGKEPIIDESLESFDVNFAIAKIKEHFIEDAVQDMLNDEINQWKPDEEDPEYYFKTGNGEAEDVIITHLIDWYSSKYPSSYSSDESEDTLREAIQKTYDFLKY